VTSLANARGFPKSIAAFACGGGYVALTYGTDLLDTETRGAVPAFYHADDTVTPTPPPTASRR